MTISIEQFDYLDSSSLFALVAKQSWAMFLDSGVIEQKKPVSKNADYDVLAINPIQTLTTQDEVTEVVCHEAHTHQYHKAEPLKILQSQLQKLGFSCKEKSVERPAYLPGAIGYFSYDLARYYETLPDLTVDDELLPQMAMGIYTCIVLIDHRKKITSLIWWGDKAFTRELTQTWRDLIGLLSDTEEELNAEKENVDNESYLNRLKSDGIQENLTQEQYQNCFDKVRQYNISGDCYQVNLAKRFAASVSGNSWQTYCYLPNTV